MSQTTTYNQKVTIYDDVASLPAPVDGTSGFEIRGTDVFTGTSAATEHALSFLSDQASATLTDIKISIYDGTEWVYLTERLDEVWTSSATIGLIAKQDIIRDIGRSERINIEAGISAGTVTINMWALEKRG